MRITKGRRRMAQRGEKPEVVTAASVWSVAGPGTTIQTACVRRPGSGTPRTSGSTTSDSVSLRAPANSLWTICFDPLLFRVGGVGCGGGWGRPHRAVLGFLVGL